MAPKKDTTAAPKPKPTHASYQDMITDAIVSLKDRNGSSRQSLKKYVKANNKLSVTDAMFDSLFNKALRTGVEKGIFEQPKGASGGTKLAKKTAKPAAKKDAADKVKKPAAKKETKKAAAPKKETTKKAAAPKKETAKKETAKKETAKKAAAPKKETKEKAAPKKAAEKKTKTGRVAKPAAKKAAAPKKAATKKATK